MLEKLDFGLKHSSRWILGILEEPDIRVKALEEPDIRIKTLKELDIRVKYSRSWILVRHA